MWIGESRVVLKSTKVLELLELGKNLYTSTRTQGVRRLWLGGWVCVCVMPHTCIAEREGKSKLDGHKVQMGKRETA